MDNYIITEKIGRSIVEMMNENGIKCIWDKENNVIKSGKLQLNLDMYGNTIWIYFYLDECGYTTDIICDRFRLNPEKEHDIYKFINKINEIGFAGNKMYIADEKLLIVERYVDCINRTKSGPITVKLNLNLNRVLEGYLHFVDGAILLNEGIISLKQALQFLNENWG